MKDKKKKYLSIVILLLLVVGITVGYAALTANLSINGTSTIGVADWEVRFANLSVSENSVEPVSDPELSEDGLTITYSVNLATPGDFYEFTVDVVNSGSIPAKLSEMPNVSGVSEAQDAYTNYTFTHADGTQIQVGEQLAAGASKKFKVRVEYDKNITNAQLPKTAQTMNLTVTMAYEQA